MNARYRQQKRQRHEHLRALKRGFIHEVGYVCVTRLAKLLNVPRTRDEKIVINKMLRAEREKHESLKDLPVLKD